MHLVQSGLFSASIVLGPSFVQLNVNKVYFRVYVSSLIIEKEFRMKLLVFFDREIYSNFDKYMIQNKHPVTANLYENF